MIGLKKVQGRPRPGPYNRPVRPRPQPPLFQQQRRFPRRPQRQPPQPRQPQRPQRPQAPFSHEPQLTLKDTFDYEDTDFNLEFDDIGYNDDFENFDK